MQFSALAADAAAHRAIAAIIVLRNIAPPPKERMRAHFPRVGELFLTKSGAALVRV
jgi:hypothetical protein